MSTVVMERLYAEPVSEETIASMIEATSACLGITGATRLQTLASADRRRFICIFEAADAQVIRRAMDSLKVEYEGIWSATVY